MKKLGTYILRLLGSLALGLSLATVTTQAVAVPVALIDGSGNLTGTTGVTVGAATYNVSFVDGSCNSLFGGCVNASFDFHNIADAIEASHALLAQVFTAFGNQPGKVLGCGSLRSCYILTPGDNRFVDDFPGPGQHLVLGGGQVVLLNSSGMYAGGTGIDPSIDVGGTNDQIVYADWTVATLVVDNNVPEPGSLVLLGLGMAALGWSRRKPQAAPNRK